MKESPVPPAGDGVDEEETVEDQEVSRSARKRAAQELRQQVEAAADLGDHAYRRLGLPPGLREAVDEARRLRPRSDERRRQLQYAAKLLRSLPGFSLRERLDALRTTASTDPELMRLERLRQELVTGGIKVINRLCAALPALDRNRLRQMVKLAREEADKTQESPDLPRPRARELFTFVRTELKRGGLNAQLEPIDHAAGDSRRTDPEED